MELSGAAVAAAVQVGGVDAVQTDAVQVSLVVIVIVGLLHEDLEHVHLARGQARHNVLAQRDLGRHQVVEDVNALLKRNRNILPSNREVSAIPLCFS